MKLDKMLEQLFNGEKKYSTILKRLYKVTSQIYLLGLLIFSCFYDFSIRFWNHSDSVVLFVFHFIHACMIEKQNRVTPITHKLYNL